LAIAARPSRSRSGGGRDTQGGTTREQTALMTNVVWGAAADVEAEPPAEPPAEPLAEPDPQAIAAYVAAGGSPFDLVGPPDWFSYSAFDTFERCPRQYAFRYLCRLPAEQARPAMDFGSAAHGAFEAFTRERRERLAAANSRPLEPTWDAASSPPGPEPPCRGGRRRDLAPARRADARSLLAAELAAEAETLGEEIRFRLRLPLDPTRRSSSPLHRSRRSPALGRGRADRLQDRHSGSARRGRVEPPALDLRPRVPRCAGPGPAERVSLYIVEHGRRFSAERTDAALEALRADLAARARRDPRQRLAPTPSRRSCGWCDFTGLCPAGAR